VTSEDNEKSEAGSH